MKRTAFWIILTIFCCASWSPAWAVGVEGFGRMSNNLVAPLSSQTDYANPLFLHKQDSVRLQPTDPFGDVLLSYSGEAQFGRLGVRSYIAGSVYPADLSADVGVAMSFSDQITPPNLTTASYLRLDVELSGHMSKARGSPFTSTIATFAISPVSGGFSPFGLTFRWRGDILSILTNQINNGLGPFVPYPAGEPSFFTPLPLPQGGRSFGARGYVDIPLGDEPFLLNVEVGAQSLCPRTEACYAITDFGSTALIGNARFVDQDRNPIQSAPFFTSASGYGYITPPGSLAAVPEPETYVMMLLGLGLLGLVLRRRQRNAAALSGPLMRSRRLIALRAAGRF